MAKIISGIALFMLIYMGWNILSDEPARVSLDWDAAERFTSIYDGVNDENAYREWYIVYKIKNREDERGVARLRFRCGRATTEFEQRDIPPHARMEGTLRVMGAPMGFDPDSCEPEYDMTRY